MTPAYRVPQVLHLLDCTSFESFSLPPSSGTQPKNQSFGLPLTLLQRLPLDIGAICYSYSPCSLAPSHLLFVWTFSSRQGLIREGDVQRWEEPIQIGHRDLCVRGEMEAIPNDDYFVCTLTRVWRQAHLTTKDMSDPHFVIVDDIGQMIRRRSRNGGHSCPDRKSTRL